MKPKIKLDPPKKMNKRDWICLVVLMGVVFVVAVLTEGGR